MSSSGLDVAAIVAAVPKLLEAANGAAKTIERTYGIVHRNTTAEINGKKGFLIWDYIVWNEITFKDEDGNITSFFTSISDKETEKVWDELVKKYGT